MPHDLKFVWPKDGYKGRSGPRGFFGRLNDIMTCRGPDIFIQRKNSTTPIKPDFWGNWDSYHLQAAHIQEVSGPGASRGFKRYDPYSRKYVQWTIPHDWDGLHSREKVYPRFTTDEWEDMASRVRRGRAPKPSSMGSDWHDEGPKRFRQEHDHFWREAHRAGENIRQGLDPSDDINPNFRMHQRWRSDVSDWIWKEGLNQNWWSYPRGRVI